VGIDALKLSTTQTPGEMLGVAIGFMRKRSELIVHTKASHLDSYIVTQGERARIWHTAVGIV
jgi:hypothetical protein